MLIRREEHGNEVHILCVTGAIRHGEQKDYHSGTMRCGRKADRRGKQA